MKGSPLALSVSNSNASADLAELHQLTRIIAEEEDDCSGKSDIEEKRILDRLHAPQNVR